MQQTNTFEGLTSFEPGAVIEINDKLGQFRKLALVNDSGMAYHDLEDDEIFPIYTNENPQLLGEPTGWGFLLLQDDPAAAAEYRQLAEVLNENAPDQLTYIRAMRWAYESRQFSLDVALSAGLNATEKVKASRAKFYDLAANALADRVTQAGA